MLISARLEESPQQEGLLTLEVTEYSYVLDKLLQLCYPMDGPDFDDLASIYSLASLAEKYEMHVVTRTLRTAFVGIVERVKENPLRAYAIACINGWEAEARIAAQHFSRNGFRSKWIYELECLSAAAYLRLNQYCRMCSRIASHAAESFSPITQNDWIWQSCSSCSGKGSLQSWGVPHTWLTDFIRRTAEALRFNPCGNTVMDHARFGEAMISAGACSHCKSRAAIDQHRFAPKLPKCVDEKLSTVCTCHILFISCD
ncbi:hypothetical protein OBBRIDRAFT_864075 [Obba rivulosa]|uniref:BTB domain-containing protein n=1 Tax=Obba rivulosa TaxID=1052685 RepID=A0A8E2AM57_9APHY|nr:hypothetical protein OBBRIDRAFT_864075 [Obba rivulosa]